MLVHGDFDDRNLLVCARRGLCAIDPLPCAGDPAYDAGYWVHANRRPGRRARLDAIVAATGLDRERVRDWAAVVGVHG
jgi:streptomycin 6-kinase